MFGVPFYPEDGDYLFVHRAPSEQHGVKTPENCMSLSVRLENFRLSTILSHL
jgi:hypothetical protein